MRFFKRQHVLLAGALALGFTLHSTAEAATSDWAETKGGRMRVIALPPSESGEVRAVLEVAPDPGWHTYWRAPGSGGIPPQITLKPGGDLALSNIEFPPPEVIELDGLTDYGYTAPVSFPMLLRQVKPGRPVKLDLDIFVGVCNDICVPFQARFELELDGSDKPASSELALFKAAEAMLPETPSEDFAVRQVVAADDSRSLIVTLKLPFGVQPDQLKLFAYDGTQAFKPISLSKVEGELATATLTPGFLAPGDTLSGKPIGLLVDTGLRAMETTIQLP